MKSNYSRRHFIQTMGATAAGLWLSPLRLYSSAPAAPVAVAKCPAYGPEVLPTLAKMFDQLGGLRRLVKGKTVAVKLNMTGGLEQRLGGRPVEVTHWTHPQVTAATVHLLGKAGARRIRILEGAWSTGEPLEEFFLKAGWQPRDFTSAASGVEFENTNALGQAKKYTRVRVPGGGLVYSAYDLNHSYVDCDVYVSLAKLKEHGTTGVTLSIKNNFGVPPTTIYGQGAGEDEPSIVPKGSRGMFHDGKRQPPKSSVAEIDPTSPRDGGYRVPRVTAELAAVRPIDLALIEGIETEAGGEGPWVRGTRYCRPGLLVAGTNCVNTDAVATALMGFDPMSDRGTAPFERCDSTLRLAEDLGLGTRDLSRIEVVGTPISQAVFNFRAV
jgi:uncharacterized protein (DUF362 family)